MKRKDIVKIAVVAALVVIAVTILLNRNTVHIVFKNLTAMKLNMDESDEWAGGKSYVGVHYATDSEAQYLDLYVPNVAYDAEKPKLFVMVHGGGFIYNDSQSRQAQLMYRYFRDNGFACATVNYRLAQEAQFPGALSDVKAAVRFLKAHADEYGFDASKVAIWGESAGGYLAVAASVTNDNEFCDVEYIGQKKIEESLGESISASVDVCVDYYGAVDLSLKDEDWKKLGIPKFIVDIANGWLHTDIMQGYPDVESFWLRKDTTELTDEERSYSDIYHYIDENLDESSTIKFWISHGDCDITVPILQSERLRDTLNELIGADNVTYHIVPGAGHAGDIMYTDQELSLIGEFLNENM